MNDKIFRQRKRLRLKDYDYSVEGLYFITICTQKRKCLFGEIENTHVGADWHVGLPAPPMVLNDAGQRMKTRWEQLREKFAGIELDEFLVLPNHIHGIISIVGANQCVGLLNSPHLQKDNGRTHYRGQTHRSAPTLGRMMQWFKTMTTNDYIHGVKQYNWVRFDGKLWQRNYYEHIIRDEDELNRIQQYIIDNPINWEDDPENIKSTMEEQFPS